MLNGCDLSQRAEERATIYSRISGVIYAIVQIVVVPAVYIGSSNTSIKWLIVTSFLMAAFYFLFNKIVCPNVSYVDAFLTTFLLIMIWVVITSVVELFYSGHTPNTNEYLLDQQLFLLSINKGAALGFIVFFGILDYMQETVRIIIRGPNVDKQLLFWCQILWSILLYLLVNLIIFATINVAGFQTMRIVPQVNWGGFLQCSMIVYLVFILGILLRKDR